uniref:Uncharacterized protein n=1 Tax=Pseudo-nitzschia multiseries DNA virus TaxID=2364897 RepID=A0A678W3H1_9VIRU|nr:hypothetical protein PmDNAV1_gp9 [Pseudo-nitzschia multiseries DNA virus]
MRYIFKNRQIDCGNMEYLIISEGKVTERFACDPARAKELATEHNLQPVSYADCVRMKIF